MNIINFRHATTMLVSFLEKENFKIIKTLKRHLRNEKTSDVTDLLFWKFEKFWNYVILK